MIYSIDPVLGINGFFFCKDKPTEWRDFFKCNSQKNKIEKIRVNNKLISHKREDGEESCEVTVDIYQKLEWEPENYDYESDSSCSYPSSCNRLFLWDCFYSQWVRVEMPSSVFEDLDYFEINEDWCFRDGFDYKDEVVYDREEYEPVRFYKSDVWPFRYLRNGTEFLYFDIYTMDYEDVYEDTYYIQPVDISISCVFKDGSNFNDFSAKLTGPGVGWETEPNYNSFGNFVRAVDFTEEDNMGEESFPVSSNSVSKVYF